MEHVKVDSSNIESVAHDAGSETMEVRFKNGGLYRYDGVTAAGHRKLMESNSKGQHLRRMDVRGVKL